MTENPAMKQITSINIKLREQIAFEVAQMTKTDLRGVLRMIETWKGRGNE